MKTTREIKFRAWDKNKKGWANPNDLKDLDNHLREIALWNASDGIFYLKESDGTIIWMQYTGLKDKNGKEIYESDIVKVNDRFGDTISRGKVEWSDTADYDIVGVNGWQRAFGISDDYYEVIGNIYQNPELLS